MVRPRWRLTFLGWFCVGAIAVGVQDCAPSVRIVVLGWRSWWSFCGRGYAMVHLRCELGFPRRCSARAIGVGGAVLCAFGAGYGVGTVVVPGHLRSGCRIMRPRCGLGFPRRCSARAIGVGVRLCAPSVQVIVPEWRLR